MDNFLRIFIVMILQRPRGQKSHAVIALILEIGALSVRPTLITLLTDLEQWLFPICGNLQSARRLGPGLLIFQELQPLSKILF